MLGMLFGDTVYRQDAEMTDLVYTPSLCLVFWRQQPQRDRDNFRDRAGNYCEWVGYSVTQELVAWRCVHSHRNIQSVHIVVRRQSPTHATLSATWCQPAVLCVLSLSPVIRGSTVRSVVRRRQRIVHLYSPKVEAITTQEAQLALQIRYRVKNPCRRDGQTDGRRTRCTMRPIKRVHNNIDPDVGITEEQV